MDLGFASRAEVLASLTDVFPDYGEELMSGSDRGVRGVRFLTNLLPEHFMDAGESARVTGQSVLLAARLLGGVASRFGVDARRPVWHSGTQHRSVPMVNHHLGHSTDVVEGAVRYALTREAAEPGTYSREDILDIMVAAAGHDVVQLNGRYIEEAQSAAFTAAMAEQTGLPPERLRNIYRAIRATTFDEKTRRQMVDPNDPLGCAVASGDLYQLHKRDGVLQGEGMIEKFAYAGKPPFRVDLGAVLRARGLDAASLSLRDLIVVVSEDETLSTAMVRLWEQQRDFFHPETGHQYPDPRFDEWFQGRRENYEFIEDFPDRLRAGETPVALHDEIVEYTEAGAVPAIVAETRAVAPSREQTALVWPQALHNPDLGREDPPQPPSPQEGAPRAPTLGPAPGRAPETGPPVQGIRDRSEASPTTGRSGPVVSGAKNAKVRGDSLWKEELSTTDPKPKASAALPATPESRSPESQPRGAATPSSEPVAAPTAELVAGPTAGPAAGSFPASVGVVTPAPSAIPTAADQSGGSPRTGGIARTAGNSQAPALGQAPAQTLPVSAGPSSARPPRQPSRPTPPAAGIQAGPGQSRGIERALEC